MNLRQYLDPGRTWKLRHFNAGVVVALGITIWPWMNHGWLATILAVAVTGAAYEVLEAYDAARGAYGPGKLGTPGYGFSWRDVAMDAAGAAGFVWADALVRGLL